MDQSLRFKPVLATPTDHPTEPRASARANSRSVDDLPRREETPRRDRREADTPADSPRSDDSVGCAPHAPSYSPSDIHVDREADFHGVTCPLNYVKTKLLLNQMQQGQVLAVLLDEAGGRSVPRSAEKDGQEVLSEEKKGDRWRVVIRKR